MIRAFLLFVALSTGGAAAWLATNKQPDGADSQEKAAAARPIAMEEILVAARSVDRGTTISADDLRWQSWPTDALTDTYVLRSQQPEAPQELSGSVLRGAVVAGEPVATGKLAPAGSSLLSAVLSPGMRAVAIPVSAERTAGGFILPEDRVDVMLTLPCRGNSGCGAETAAKTILRSVRVLAIDQSGAENNTATSKGTLIGKTATLEVRPDQAEALVGADAMGTLSLVLRAATDREIVEAALPQLRQHTIRVLRNGVGQSVSVQ